MNKMQSKRKIESILTTILVTFLLEFSIVPIVSSTSTIYYVSTTGNDTTGDGSFTNPWRTLEHASSIVTAGDNVFVRGGIYYEQVFINTSGTANKPIIFSTYNNEIVVINGNGHDIRWSKGVFTLGNQSYITINGFTIEDSTFAGIAACGNGSGHITISNCIVHDCASSGIFIYSGDYTKPKKIHDINIKNNVVYDVNLENDQEAVTLRYADNFFIYHNYLYHLHKIGIDVKNGSSNGRICNNEINCSENANGDPSPGIYIDAGNRNEKNIQIYNNKLYGIGQGISLATEKGGTLNNITIFNNLICVKSNGFSIHKFGNTSGTTHLKQNITVINNDFFENSICIQITDGRQNFRHFIIRNNIFNTSKTIMNWRYLTSQDVTNDHNLFSKNPGSMYIGNNYIIDNPKFVTPVYNNARYSDLHLQPTSVVINTGSKVKGPLFDYEGNVRPHGSYYDMGAYEYCGISPPWDVNIDGVCSILDFMLIGNRLGQKGSPGWIREDVDDNGEIQLFDLMMISSHYGEFW
jgi:hypothetical protein